MIVIHHNKDMDGFASGAICKLKYPDARLIGWDYKDEIPDFSQFIGEDVIMIDITFPLNQLLELGDLARLTVIDHHISFKKQVNELDEKDHRARNFTYIYEDRVAACEIGWKYLFPEKPVPHGITLIGRYDTWRQEEGNWEEETLPFKYYMYGNCNSAESFPKGIFNVDKNDALLTFGITQGKGIMKYQQTMDESLAERNAFIANVYGGLRALCINYSPFSSETLKSMYKDELYDLMIGFCFTNNEKWSVSLRSTEKSGVDVSDIAKRRGGGGHKNAAGFEVNKFEDIFK